MSAGEIVHELSRIVGDEHVLADGESLARAERATFATSQRIVAIVRPRNRGEVQQCVRASRQAGVPLYTVSGGRNWGLGSRVPARDGCVLLELGRMNAIVDFDEELAFVTVEPGVTFQQLYDFLRERGSRLFANTTGASPHASVIGNALERGDGTGPYGDRISAVCALEVVLGTGECLHTGFDRFSGARARRLHRWGVGPALDGLFSQSNLGIVTQLTLWLAPLPRALAAVRFRTRDPARLGPLIDALRELRLEGTLRSVGGIWNDYRVLSTIRQYPWELARNETPLSRELLATLSDQWGGARWLGLTAIYAASAEQCRAHRARVERLLGDLVDELDIEERSGEPQSGAELFAEREPALAFLQGIPHEGSLQSVYWRKRGPIPASPDPDRDRCGVLWLCPALPLRGADVVEAAELSERRMLEHGFDPMIAMVAQTERTLYLIPLILYDRDIDGEDERALGCHDALLSELLGRGYLPYRLGIQSMNALPAPHDDWLSAAARIKRALDPDGVLSPGRYDFEASSDDKTR